MKDWPTHDYEGGNPMLHERVTAAPWYKAWPPRPPADDDACPTCGYGLDDGSGTKHECPPGFRDQVAATPSRRMTKKEAALRLWIIAGEIGLTLDEHDEDCPTWVDDLDRIAKALHPTGGE